MTVNLSNYECVPTRSEYNKIYNRFKKIIIPKNIKSSKMPICKIYIGPPGSGKSLIAGDDKINIDTDKIIDGLYESEELAKLGIKHGNVIDSCGDIGARVSDDILNLCVKKTYNFSTHHLYGVPLEFLYYLRENGYKIKTYYVYSYNAYVNNVNRKGLNISKKVYKGILRDMMNSRAIFALFSVSDYFEFVCIRKIGTKGEKFNFKKSKAGEWHETKQKMKNIINKVRESIN